MWKVTEGVIEHYGRRLNVVNPFAALLTSYLVMRKPVAVCPSDEYTRHNPIAVMLSVAHSVAAIF